MSHAVVSVQDSEANKSAITQATFEEYLGRKLTFSEKVVFKIFNKKIKKIARSKKYQRQTKVNDCAKIVLKTGEVLEVDLIEVSATKVKYKRCDKTDDPEFTVDKKDIFSIQDAAGEVLYTNNNPREENSINDKEETARPRVGNEKDKQTQGMAPASFIIGILSILLITSASPFALLFGVIATILGVISKNKIKKNPKRFKGKKLASAGFVMGIITCALFLLAALALFVLFI